MIIVDGQSTVGKSTLSKSVDKQISKHEKSYWLHEECIKHPIRHEEFKAGGLTSNEGMALNKKSMLEKWGSFRDAIEKKNQVCITEGCLLHAYDRYFAHSVWDEEQIQDYYKDVLQSVESLNPLIWHYMIFLSIKLSSRNHLPVVLCGWVDPPQIFASSRVKFFSSVHMLVLTCEADVQTARLKARYPKHRKTPPDAKNIEMALRATQIMKKEAEAYDNVTTLDTTHLIQEQTVSEVERWILERL
ncbi:MAG: hypothetical protein HOH77_14675 [Candidatus Latescibacteria bacterium]|nr:hypothetical protein [Candidatus Latescibacterota bacterium]